MKRHSTIPDLQKWTLIIRCCLVSFLERGATSLQETLSAYFKPRRPGFEFIYEFDIPFVLFDFYKLYMQKSSVLDEAQGKFCPCIPGIRGQSLHTRTFYSTRPSNTLLKDNRCPKRNGYRCRKWIPEFKSLAKLIVFHFILGNATKSNSYYIEL